MFTTDELKEFHGDQPPNAVSQTASIQIGMPEQSQTGDSVGQASTQEGPWLSLTRKHTAAAVTPTGSDKMDVDSGSNWYTVLESLGKTRSQSGDPKSPDNRKQNKCTLAEKSHMEQHLASEPPPEPLPPGAPPPLQKYTSDGRRLGGSFILRMIDSAAQTMTGVTHADTAENSVTGGQSNNLGDSNSDL